MKNKVNFREYILGGQDGIVNVLGLVLGVASATNESRIVIIAGIVATVAESVSMAAVAYTSSDAAKDYYLSMTKKNKNHLNILQKYKFLLKEYQNPIKSTIVVGMATLIGSLIPLFPFFFFNVKTGILVSLIFSALILFIVGALKSKLSIGNWKKSGVEMMLIGIIAALVGYLAGLLLKGI